MPARKTMPSIKISSLISGLIMHLIFICAGCHGNPNERNRDQYLSGRTDSKSISGTADGYQSINAVLVLPRNPEPGKPFRILATGGKNILKAKIIVSGPAGNLESMKSKTSEELPYWRIDNFSGSPAGKHTGHCNCREYDSQ